MSSSIRRAFRQNTDSEVYDTSSTTNTTPTKSFFRSSLRGRSGSKADKPSGNEPGSPSKTKRTIKTSDITYIFSDDNTSLRDFSPVFGLRNFENRNEDCFSRPGSPPLMIDKALVDQFPLPPVVHAYTSPDVRVPVTSPDFEYGLSVRSDGLLPPPHPRVQQYMDEQKALNGSLRRQPLVSSSSVTSYSRPTATAYSALFEDNGSSTSSLPPSPSDRSSVTHHHTYRRLLHSQSLSSRSPPPSVRTLLHQRSHSDMNFERPGRRIRLRAQTPVGAQ
ncbi:hypothetical protein EV359DRAFT_77795 [Lentinula novae-zelandiae]|nr:hypothetical protein EV359DRAFT_77795 [Lentinula novae-zelandiae]